MDREQLEAAIAAQEGLRGSVPDDVVEAAIAALRARADSMPDTQRRRLATVLFGDLRGFTAMAETVDAEELSEVMNAVWARLDATIAEHGGHIDKHMGDGLMAIWGASATREDDPERAVRAGLGLQSALGEFREERGIPLEMRVGISSGQVVLGTVGTTGEFTALGDAVNLASRLEHEAPTHGVLLSHETYRHVRGVFEAVARPPMAIRGKTALVRTYLVSAVKPRAFRSPSRGVEGVETTMVGRDRELSELERAYFTAVERGASVWVQVSGDAGAGKSRLLWEFENWLELRPEPIVFLSARATPSRRSAPLGLLHDLIANRLDITDTDPPDAVRTKLVHGTLDALDHGDAVALGRWLGFDLGQRTMAGPDSEALASLGRAHLERYLRSLARRNPTVVLLEDLHWADDVSLDTLSWIQRNLADESLIVVSTSRQLNTSTVPDNGAGSLVQVELSALDDDDIQALLREILARAEDLPRQFARTLTERAGSTSKS